MHNQCHALVINCLYFWQLPAQGTDHVSNQLTSMHCTQANGKKFFLFKPECHSFYEVYGSVLSWQHTSHVAHSGVGQPVHLQHVP
jgi:hypothetical protein